MSAWERYWFGPVAGVRPFVLERTVLFLLALDVWTQCVPHGARYGAGDFNVAHFAWLDVVQPMPTPSLHVGLMLIVGDSLGSSRAAPAAVRCACFWPCSTRTAGR